MLTVIITRHNQMFAYNFGSIEAARDVIESRLSSETINLFIDGRSTPIATFGA